MPKEDELIDSENDRLVKFEGARDVAFGVLLWLNMDTCNLLLTNILRHVCLNYVENPILNYSISIAGAAVIALLVSYFWIKSYYQKQNKQRIRAIVQISISVTVLLVMNLLFVIVLSEHLFVVAPEAILNYYDVLEEKIPQLVISEFLVLIKAIIILVMSIKMRHKILNRKSYR